MPTRGRWLAGALLAAGCSGSDPASVPTTTSAPGGSGSTAVAPAPPTIPAPAAAEEPPPMVGPTVLRDCFGRPGGPTPLARPPANARPAQEELCD